MPIKGIDEAKVKIINLANKAPKVAQKAMTEVLMTIGTQANSQTPIDTSTLINSQFRVITDKDGVINGRIGYAVKYAKFVHDPNVKQNFRLPRAKKEFLKLAIEETKEIQEKIIRSNFDAIV